MTAAPIRGAFASKLPRAVTFTAWRVPHRRDEAIPLEIPATMSLTGALNEVLATHKLQHRDTLLIRHDDTGRNFSRLHTWTIKRKSQPRYVRGADGTSKPVHDLYAADPFSLTVEAFEPVRPFDALRDDAVGADLSLVEAE